MDQPHPPASNRPAAAAAHPGRSPPSPRTTPRLTGAPHPSTRRARVSSPPQTKTSYAWPNTPASPAGSSKSPQPAGARTRFT